MDEALRAGIALYNAGEYHAAHDPWEAAWLPLESGLNDERLLHGLIQYTATIYHARDRNWGGAVGLAASAHEYLTDLPPAYRGVDLHTVRAYLRALAADPERIERGSPPPLRLDGKPLAAVDLGLDALALAAAAVAEEYDAFEEATIEAAVGYAREEAGTGRSAFRTLLIDFVDFVDGDRRSVVYDRLSAHVDRRRNEESDVSGLF